ncbi:MAG: SpoIIE family protein phosphatase [Phycisphaerales bacterium]|nr:SpoIIE family protein phosphatase [Phycisphaerales bacterium]
MARIGILANGQMRLILLENGAMVSEFFCAREAIHIGSASSCRIHIPDSRIAHEQVVIFPEAGNVWVLQQLDNSIEVRVSGQNVHDKLELKTGDEIELGDFVVRVFPDQVDQAGPRVESTGHSTVAQLTRFVQSQLPPGAVIKKVDEPLSVHPSHVHRIGAINIALSGCNQVEELMNIALREFASTFAAQRVWIGIRRVNYGAMEYVEGRSMSGQSVDLPEYGDRVKPRVLDRAQFVFVPLWSTDERVSILAGPLNGPDGTLGMIYIDSGDSGRKFDLQDVDYFIVMSNLFAVQLDAIFRAITKQRQATMDGEVSVAHEIQARLTPRKLPQSDQLQFGAFREPGRANTGDLYDVVKLGNGLLAVIVTHCPHGGAMPSLLMSAAHAAFRIAAMHQDAPHVFLRSLNWILFDPAKDRSLNCFIGTIDPATGVIQYSLAGAIGAFIIDARGEERPMRPTPAPAALGLDRSVQYQLLTETIDSDENLVLFTPGVTTAKNSKGEVFGEARFVNILCDGFGQLASQLLKEMLTDLRAFTEGGMQPDDITVLLAHRE